MKGKKNENQELDLTQQYEQLRLFAIKKKCKDYQIEYNEFVNKRMKSWINNYAITSIKKEKTIALLQRPQNNIKEQQQKIGDIIVEIILRKIKDKKTTIMPI